MHDPARGIEAGDQTPVTPSDQTPNTPARLVAAHAVLEAVDVQGSAFYRAAGMGTHRDLQTALIRSAKVAGN